MSRHADDDVVTNTSNNPHLDQIIAQRLADPARRRLLKGSAGAAALAFVGAPLALSGCGGSDDPAPAPSPAPARPTSLGFTAVPKSLADTVTVPAGYTATVLYRLGDPIAATVPDYRNDGTDSAASFAWRAGDHHDAIAYFGLGADGKYSPTNSSRGLLVMNHEAITPIFLHPNGPTIVGSGTAAQRTVPDEVLREYYAHGISVVEVEKNASGVWSYKKSSLYNRRIHTLTECALSGPAAGTSYMVTKYSPNGTRTRGTINNCAHGVTPWHTYIGCEENWAGYFRRITATDNPNRTAKELTAFARYGVAGNGRELWATVTPDTPDDLYGRWNAEVRGATAADDYRNAPNTYGWNVEFDPFDPASTPKKRTAMGRFAHEGAWFAKAVAGKPIVVYMGCDSRNEYIYKYVSAANWDPADASRGMAAGDKYLDNGKLYVAKFNADGTGQWLELSFGVNGITPSNATYPFADAADVAIHTRLAADAAGGTKMDRPEWGAVDPVTGAVYMTLTNNNATLRSLAATDPANPRHYNDPRTNGSAQRGNPNGHIIRWIEPSPEATTFRWDIFLFGARAGADPANVNLSGLTADNDFSSPDGLWFSEVSNICWIQTDDGAYTDVTNCMLLAALPGTVGDGGARTITNTDASGNTKQVTTYVGAPLGATKLRRFLVGPKDCEITGICETPDGQTLFVNIQHPGEDTPAAAIGDPAQFTSHWPDGGTSRPRSATIAIQKVGGGIVGL
jgi:secreted PhoX family phosphatase